MTHRTKLERQFEAHDRAAQKARDAGATPRDAAIQGMVAELMLCRKGGR